MAVVFVSCICDTFALGRMLWKKRTLYVVSCKKSILCAIIMFANK
jgi:hypothetical protein